VFTPPTVSRHNSSRTLTLDNGYAAAYASGLVPVDAEQVDLLELLHTLQPTLPGATAADFIGLGTVHNGISGLFRDPAGTLVVRHEQHGQDAVSLLWPVGRRLAGAGDGTVVHVADRAAFVEAAGVDGLVPLPLAIINPATVFGWGYSGAGPHLLYQALVHAVDGSVAPATDGRFLNEPGSFYGWLTRQDKAGFTIGWPELLERVDADWPLREVFASAS
jgi:hypothetical protein